jgi:hypothetical protein
MLPIPRILIFKHHGFEALELPVERKSLDHQLKHNEH